MGIDLYEEEKKGEAIEGERSPKNAKKIAPRKSELSTPLKKTQSA